jgi:hypothetical protein
MHHIGTDVTWLVAVVGAGVLARGLVGLRAPSSTPAYHTSQAALGRLWMGLFALVEAVPRLAGWPSGPVLALSVAALAPLLLACRALQRR